MKQKSRTYNSLINSLIGILWFETQIANHCVFADICCRMGICLGRGSQTCGLHENCSGTDGCACAVDTGVIPDYTATHIYSQTSTVDGYIPLGTAIIAGNVVGNGTTGNGKGRGGVRINGTAAGSSCGIALLFREIIADRSAFNRNGRIL